MKEGESPASFNFTQRLIFLIVTVCISLLLVFLRADISHQAPLDQLARKSIQPEIALSNGRPTVIEFYADWCEACKEMAPAIIDVESIYKDKVDFVFLNVDNSKWQDLISLYQVTGIPQLNFFSSEGDLEGVVIGVKSKETILDLVNALSNKEPLPQISFAGNQTNLISIEKGFAKKDYSSNIIIPKSHG